MVSASSLILLSECVRKKANQEYLEVLNKLIKEYGSREVCAEVYIHKANHLRRLEPKRADEALKV